LTINSSTIAEVKINDPLTNEYVFYDLSPPNTPFLIRMRTFNSVGLSELLVETVETTFESGQ
jgi:hypothetical protein